MQAIKILEILAKSENASAITYLDLSSTRIGYNGIIQLLKSSTFGSLISDSPTYEKHTGVPVSIIKVEIQNTRCYEQYKKKLFKYPLPLIRDFNITYGHRLIGKQYKNFGYKQIILLNYGKELI